MNSKTACRGDLWVGAVTVLGKYFGYGKNKNYIWKSDGS